LEDRMKKKLKTTDTVAIVFRVFGKCLFMLGIFLVTLLKIVMEASKSFLVMIENLGKYPKAVACIALVISCLIALFVIDSMLEDMFLSDSWRTLFLTLPVFATIGGIVQILNK